MLNILLTNDDGIDAPGLNALVDCLQHAIGSRRPELDCNVLVVAPDRCRSECGHSVENSRPLTIQSVGENRYSLDGTPVDCVRAAIYALKFQPDAVISGINAGANLGVNLMVSGTFAAAREANLLGIASLAASHYRRPEIPKTWDHAARWMEITINEFLDDVLLFRRNSQGPSSNRRHLVDQPPPLVDQPPLWNVNLPAVDPGLNFVPERIECDVDRCPIDRSGTVEVDGRVRFELDFHARAREPGRDVQECFDGRITISKLRLHVG